MALIDDVRTTLARLAPHGWRALFRHHGLDIEAQDLEAELARLLPAIDRTQPGFEDFAVEGMFGVTPTNPARSLLYHALASPRVTAHQGRELDAFPTLSELETVENYVFAVASLSLEDLVRNNGLSRMDELSVVLFATEYRPAADTPHKAHADTCFSRVGVSRVGTRPPRYVGEHRGFTPVAQNGGIAVVPCRYSPWLAVRRRGDALGDALMRRKDQDTSLGFWVPVHKLFTGTECLRDEDLSVNLGSGHRNDKLRRIHEELERLAPGAPGSDVPPHQLAEPPYTLADGIIADLSTHQADGTGLLVPADHAALAEPARDAGGRYVGFHVPPNAHTLFSSVRIRPDGGTPGGSPHQPRTAPEYVHARTAIDDDGTLVDLNEVDDVTGHVRAGNYRALHYVDYTGDGWITASIPSLRGRVDGVVAAYSLVTAPDFFPRTEQRELDEFGTRIAEALGLVSDELVWRIPPAPLCDARLPVNIQLPGGHFHADDVTSMAVISMPASKRVATDATAIDLGRSPHLPDAAGNFYEPGWDVSLAIDRSAPGGPVEHLAAFGLGSPFPEDAKLCSALSAFWPGASPDTARTFAPQGWPTVTPMTDSEIGFGGELGWDGVPGPEVFDHDGERHIAYTSFEHADYTRNAEANRLVIERTHHIGRGEYQNRTLVMLLAYRAIGELTTPPQRRRTVVLSFRKLDATDDEVKRATTATGATMANPVYRVEMASPQPVRGDPRHPGDRKRRAMKVVAPVVLLIGNGPVLRNDGEGAWRRA